MVQIMHLKNTKRIYAIKWVFQQWWRNRRTVLCVNAELLIANVSVRGANVIWNYSGGVSSSNKY